MKRDDPAILDRGLSESEAVLSEPIAAEIEAADQVVREHVGGLLYFQLRVARAAAIAMDRMPAWDFDYVHKHRERELALARASQHYRSLLAMGGIPADLAEMVLAEGGLTP